MTEQLDQLIAFCREKDRVCPMPILWNRLWQMLPDRRRAGPSWEPMPPLILAGWWASSDDEKQERLVYHLTWAAERGALDPIERFLHELPETDWHHRGA